MSEEPKRSTQYLSMTPIDKLYVSYLGGEVGLSVKDHANGLISFLPVFESEEAAKAYSDREVLELEVLGHKV